MEKYEVTILNFDTKSESNFIIEVDEAETTDDIIFHAVISGQEVSSVNYGYFSAYQQFRDKLLSLGYGIKCDGSRINAVQSGMMGSTDKIYLVESGKQALMKDIKSIFDYADINEFPDTQEQNIFFNEWCNSLH